MFSGESLEAENNDSQKRFVVCPDRSAFLQCNAWVRRRTGTINSVGNSPRSLYWL